MLLIIASINFGRLNKIRVKSKMSRNEKKGTRRKAYLAKKVVRRSPSCRTGDDGLDIWIACINSDLNSNMDFFGQMKIKMVGKMAAVYQFASIVVTLT